jgi:hypothetical protein
MRKRKKLRTTKRIHETIKIRTKEKRRKKMKQFNIKLKCGKKNLPQEKNIETVSHKEPEKKEEKKEEKNIIDFSFPEKNDKEIPYMITDEYLDDLNLLRIHNTIRTRFGALLSRTDVLKKKVIFFHEELKNHHLSVIEVKDKEEKIAKLETEIEDIETGRRWNEYVSRAQEILNNYLPLASDESKGIVSLTFKKNKERKNKEEVDMRCQLIQEYIDIAKDYIKLNILRKSVLTSQCPNCGAPSESLFLNDELGVYTCTCGYVIENLDKSSNTINEKVTNSGKSYDNQLSFEKLFESWEGTSTDRIPDNLEPQLDQYFKLKGLPIGDQVRSMPLLPNGKRGNTSIKMMETALKETNNSSYYYLIFPLTYSYWNWRKPCNPENKPCSTDIKSNIYDKHFQIQKVYEGIKDRDSCLNGHIILYSLLLTEGYPCSKEDFKFLISTNCLEQHQEKIEIMFRETGITLPFKSLF